MIQDSKLQNIFSENLGSLTDWPLENYLAIIYERGKIYGHNEMIFADHDFQAKDAITFLRNENVDNILDTATIIDSTSPRTFQKCHGEYSRHLKDIQFHFNDEFDNNIIEIGCHSISRNDFIEKYVLTKTPLKLKSCFHKNEFETKEILPEEGYWHNEYGKDLYSKDIEEALQNNYNKNNNDKQFSKIKAHLTNSTSILDNLVYLYSKNYNYNFDDQSLLFPGTKFNYFSLNNGQILQKDIVDQFYFLPKGLKWIVIIPPITRQTVVKLSCELSSPQSVIYQTSNWFENVQPQLKNKKFHDRWVIQTMLKPGDVLYLPSENYISSYAAEDSLILSKKFLTTSSLDSFILQKEDNNLPKNYQLFSDFLETRSNKMEQNVIIEKCMKVKRKWEELDLPDLEKLSFII